VAFDRDDEQTSEEVDTENRQPKPKPEAEPEAEPEPKAEPEPETEPDESNVDIAAAAAEDLLSPESNSHQLKKYKIYISVRCIRAGKHGRQRRSRHGGLCRLRRC